MEKRSVKADVSRRNLHEMKGQRAECVIGAVFDEPIASALGRSSRRPDEIQWLNRPRRLIPKSPRPTRSAVEGSGMANSMSLPLSLFPSLLIRLPGE